MKNFKSLGFYAALILVLLLIVTLLFSGTGEKRIKYSQVLDHFENKEVYYSELLENGIFTFDEGVYKEGYILKSVTKTGN